MELLTLLPTFTDKKDKELLREAIADIYGVHVKRSARLSPVVAVIVLCLVLIALTGCGYEVVEHLDRRLVTVVLLLLFAVFVFVAVFLLTACGLVSEAGFLGFASKIYNNVANHISKLRFGKSD